MIRRAAWAAVVLLVAIGVAAAIGRSVFVHSFAHRAEPIRERMMHSLGRENVTYREEDLTEVDTKFGRWPAITLLHVVPGGLFLLLAPLQLAGGFRDRHRRIHRRLGRVLMIAAMISAACGLFFGLYHPLGGWLEALGIVTFGALLFVCAIRGWVAIRNGHVEVHREWMIRTFAVALAISTVRVMVTAFDIAGLMTPHLRGMFTVSIWSGWLLTVGLAEIWIRHTRRSSHDHRFALDPLQQKA
jgi:uncharacterized membrane protein